MRSLHPTEHQEQAALIEWCRSQWAVLPELSRLFAIPNGGLRNIVVAKKLKAEGSRKGVPDLFLPIPRGKYHGMFIEMKRAAGGRISVEQKDWIEFLEEQGYYTIVAYGWEHARIRIEYYLNLK